MRSTEHEIFKGHHRVESISLICLRKPEFCQQKLKMAEIRGVAESLAPQKRMVVREVKCRTTHEEVDVTTYT